MMRKLKNVSRKTFKYRFVVELNQIDVKASKTWQPYKLLITLSRRKKKVSTVAKSWHPSIENPYFGSVKWSTDETIELDVTLFQDGKKSSFLSKEWVFVLENEASNGKRKAIATSRLDLARFATELPSCEDVHIAMKPLLLRRLVSVNLHVSVSSRFLSTQTATESDLLSVAGSTTSENTLALGDVNIANLHDLDGETSSRASSQDSRLAHEINDIASQIAALNPSARLDSTVDSVFERSSEDLSKDRDRVQSVPERILRSSDSSQVFQTHLRSSSDFVKRNNVTQDKPTDAEGVAESSTQDDDNDDLHNYSVNKRRLQSYNSSSAIKVDSVSDLQDTRSPAQRSGELLTWCQECTRSHRGVRVTNFTTSWRNGLALCALIHHHRSDLVDYNLLSPTNSTENTNTALRACKLLLGGSDVGVTSLKTKSALLALLGRLRERFSSEQKHDDVTEGDDVTTAPSRHPFIMTKRSDGGELARLRDDFLVDLEEQADVDDIFSCDLDYILETDDRDVTALHDVITNEAPCATEDLIPSDVDDHRGGGDHEAIRLDDVTCGKDDVIHERGDDNYKGEASPCRQHSSQHQFPNGLPSPVVASVTVETNTRDDVGAESNDISSMTLRRDDDVIYTPSKTNGNVHFASDNDGTATSTSSKDDVPESNDDVIGGEVMTSAAPNGGVKLSLKRTNAAPAAVKARIEPVAASSEITGLVKSSNHNVTELFQKTASENHRDDSSIDQTVSHLLKSSKERTKKSKVMELIEKAKSEALSEKDEELSEEGKARREAIRQRSQLLISATRDTLQRQDKLSQTRHHDDDVMSPTPDRKSPDYGVGFIEKSAPTRGGQEGGCVLHDGVSEKLTALEAAISAEQQKAIEEEQQRAIEEQHQTWLRAIEEERQTAIEAERQRALSLMEERQAAMEMERLRAIEEQRQRTIEEERQRAIEAEQQIAIEAERQTAMEAERLRAIEEEHQRFIEAEHLRAIEEERQTAMKAERLRAIEEEHQRAIKAEQQRAIKEERQAAIEAEYQAAMEAERLRAIEEQRQRSIEKECQRAIEAERQRAIEEERERAIEAERKRSIEVEHQRAMEAERLRAIEEERQTAIEAERKRAIEVESERAMEAERLRAIEEERQTAIEAERQRALEEERKTAIEAERQRAIEEERQRAIKEEREAAIEAEHQAAMETERLIAIAKKRQTAIEAEQQKAVEAEEKKAIEAECQRAIEEEQQRAMEVERQAAIEAERQRALKEERQATIEAEQQRAVEEECQRAIKVEREAAIEAEHQAAMETEQLRAIEEKRQIAMEAEQQKAMEAERQKAMEAERQKAMEAERQKAMEAERQKAMEAEQQKAMEAEQQKAMEAERQKAREAERQKAREAERQTAREVERQKAREAEEKKTLEAERKKAIEAERQRAIEEEQLRAAEAEQQRRINEERQSAIIKSKVEDERSSLERELRSVEERSLEVQHELRNIQPSRNATRKQREGQLTQEWIQLVNKKNQIVRQQDQLALHDEEREILRKLDENNKELLALMTIEEEMKTQAQRTREERLLEEKFSLVDQHDQIVQALDEKEQTAVDEDERLQRTLGENMNKILTQQDDEKCSVM